MLTLSGAILALTFFLLGYAWARRTPAEPVVYRAGRWAVTGTDCHYELRCEGQPIARFASYHKARHAADMNHGATR